MHPTCTARAHTHVARTAVSEYTYLQVSQRARGQPLQSSTWRCLWR